MKLNTRAHAHLILAWAVCSLALVPIPGRAVPFGSSVQPTGPEAGSHEAIPWSQVGARAESTYAGEGLRVLPAAAGASLFCRFQNLEGEATSEGLWLSSTTSDVPKDRFRILATAVGRHPSPAVGGDGLGIPESIEGASFGNAGVCTSPGETLAGKGRVSVGGKTARFHRPGLLEEYRVGMDGVRQDFLVMHRPAGTGELRVALEVTGARVENAHYGARLVLNRSERRIAYSRLQVEDASGRSLDARIRVTSENQLVVLMNDTDARYPVRIDPTFSDENWISMGGLPGAGGLVQATVVDASGNLYIGGSFTIAGEVAANNIAKWNGTEWSALGSGLNISVYALAAAGNDLYVGGNFWAAGGISASRIARWNGSTWSALGTGVNGSVRALVMSGGELYVAGSFTTAGGSPASRIAKWNGSAWSALGAGVDGDVQALAISGSDLFAGGQFSAADGGPASRIAKWDGSQWSALGSGVNDAVNALACSGGDLFAAGRMTVAGGIAANRVARWNGIEWSALGTGLNGTVNALVVSGDDVLVGGAFTSAGGGLANRVAKWNGSDWSAVGSGANGDVFSLATFGSDLYAGGQMTTAGGNAASRVARWDGSAWTGLGIGSGNSADSTVMGLAVIGGDVYVGGFFTMVGGIPSNRIARWDGSAWSALGSGLNGDVYALAASGSDLYVAGQFTLAGGIPASGVAKWNGTSWTALGPGLGDRVSALAVLGGDLVAGGRFTFSGTSVANRVARWNGSTWSALGAGVNDYVHALAVSGGDLYVGGQFTTAGGNPANRIARWDGSTWSPLETGLSATVWALAVRDNDLYVGGAFTTAGGQPCNYIARWGGSSWFPMGTGLNSSVRTLAVMDDRLYVGGQFTAAGGVGANYLAQWEENAWSPLGSGLNNTVFALAVSGGQLYAGGAFTTAGGTVSAHLARAIVSDNLPPTGILLSSLPVPENQPGGAAVGTLSAVDSDAFDSHLFELANGAGDDDNAAFVIVGNEVRTTGTLDYESKSSHHLRVRATDTGGLWVEQAFVVQIQDVDDAPVLELLTPASAQVDGPGFDLTVTGSGFLPGATVYWNHSARPTTWISSFAVAVAVPATDLATGTDISVAAIHMVNGDGQSSNPLGFSIVAQSVGGVAASVAQPGETVHVSTAPTTAGDPGVSVTVQNGGDGSITVLAAAYATRPVGETAFRVDNGAFVDLQITGADESISAAAFFYYPSDVVGGMENRTRLRYFDGVNWIPVLSSGGLPPSRDISDNLDGTVSGGRFTVVFDTTSTPTIMELAGTVFGMFESPPQIDAVAGPADPVALGGDITVAVDYVVLGDPNAVAVTFIWGDGTEIMAIPSGAGGVSATHLYAMPGVYGVTVRITDAEGDVSEGRFENVVIYDPEGGFVTGGGWIDSPPGACVADATLSGRATFGFVSRYQKGRMNPTGQTQFQFQAGDFQFHSTSYEWLVVRGAAAQYKGAGLVNGMGDYGFLLTATDGQLAGGDGGDKFRLKIWTRDTGQVVYDNRLGISDAPDNADPQQLGGGSIVIHKPK